MPEFSKIKLEILKCLTYELDTIIDFRYRDYDEKDRLRYVSCINDIEKNEVTKKQISKMQKKITKCDEEIAGYVTELIKGYKYDNAIGGGGYEAIRKAICENFLLDFPDELEEIAKKYKSVKSVINEDSDFWIELLTDEPYVYNTDIINNFIKYMVIAERLTTYMSLLEVSSKENIEFKGEVENIQKKINNTKEFALNSKQKSYIFDMLESLGITTNNIAALSERKKGAIRGVVITLRDNNILPQISLETLIKNIATIIGLEINSKLDSTKISDDFEKKARKYIKDNPF